MAADAPVCRCGHPREMHAHHSTWRTDCGRCGAANCAAYRRADARLADGANRRIHRLLAIIRRRQ